MGMCVGGLGLRYEVRADCDWPVNGCMHCVTLCHTVGVCTVSRTMPYCPSTHTSHNTVNTTACMYPIPPAPTPPLIPLLPLVRAAQGCAWHGASA